MPRASFLLIVLLALPLSWHSTVLAGDDDEKIIGTWERDHEKEELEETWIIKKTKDKWSVSGTFFKRGQEVGNFKGKDVKYADDTLSFTQDFFKLPKGFKTGAKITASAEEDRLDFASKQGQTENKDNMKRAGDASEVLGTWKTAWGGFNEAWLIEKDKKGVLSIRGTYTKGDKEVGSWKGVNVRYFMRTLMFNQQFDKLPPTKLVDNGNAVAGVGRGGEFVFIWTNGKRTGKSKMMLDTGK
jgi:hypothetical protein